MGDRLERLRAYRLPGAAGAMKLLGPLVLGPLLLGTGTAMAAAPLVPQPDTSRAPHYTQVAGLFGESDDEIAARQQREQAQDASIASLTQRVSDLEQALRQQTGQLEEANHNNMLLQQKMDRMRKDFEYRLCQLTAQQMGSSGDNSDQGGLDCTAAGAPASDAPMPMQSGQPPHAASVAPPTQAGQPSGVLGTLPKGTPVPKPHQNVTVDYSSIGGAPAGQGPNPQPASSGTKSQFDSAMNLLAKAQYDDARAAFRSFADANPKDDLAPQAVYWVGSIAYVQKDYPGAARAFAEEIKEYPSSPRGPESMLKLGQSLIAMKQKQEGCTTLGALSSKYPKASSTIRREADKSRHEAHCR